MFVHHWSEGNVIQAKEFRKELMRLIRRPVARHLEVALSLVSFERFLRDSLFIYDSRLMSRHALAEERDYIEACYVWCKRRYAHFSIRHDVYTCHTVTRSSRDAQCNREAAPTWRGTSQIGQKVPNLLCQHLV